MPTATKERKKGAQPPRKSFKSPTDFEKDATRKAKESSMEAEERLLKSWRFNHEKFVKEALIAPYNLATGSNHFMSEQQKEASAAYSKLLKDKKEGKRRDILGISIMSGKGTGKDAWASWAILHFMTCFSYPKIPCTSVSGDQLSKVLWSELAKWLMHSPLKAHHKLQSDLLYCATVPKDVMKKRWFAFPKAANPKNSHEEQVETLQGIHEDHLLQVVDEGSGVLAPVFNALIDNQTGPVNLMINIFNPTRAKCYAVETQYSEAHRWVCLRWNAEESELVDPSVIKAAREKYGDEYAKANPYRIKILGLPPMMDEETLIPWDWIEDAVNREVEPLATDPIVKGVDPGAGGDASIIATRKGPKVYPMRENKTADSTVLENWVGANIDAEDPDCVRVDTIGIGWAVEGNLRDKKGAIVEAADFRKTSDEPEKYFNKRSESFWRMREAFRTGAITIPNDEDLKDELGAIKVEYGKVTRVVEKKKIKDDLGHSPDRADALAMTYYYPDWMVSKNRNKKARSGRDDAPVPGSWMAA